MTRAQPHDAGDENPELPSDGEQPGPQGGHAEDGKEGDDPLPESSFREEQEHRDRAKGDAELFAVLRADGFAGGRWEKVKFAMAHYGIGALQGWARQGTLAAKLAGCGPFRLTVEELRLLTTDRDFRDSVIDIAVTEALVDFRVRGLEDTGWNAAGGASLTTYFTKACLFKLGNELSRQRRSNTRYRRETTAAVGEIASGVVNSIWDDEPFRAVSTNEIIEKHLSELSERDREIVVAKAFRYSVAEISELYEIPERTIRQRWAWLMKNVEWVGRLGGRAES